MDNVGPLGEASSGGGMAETWYDVVSGVGSTTPNGGLSKHGVGTMVDTLG